MSDTNKVDDGDNQTPVETSNTNNQPKDITETNEVKQSPQKINNSTIVIMLLSAVILILISLFIFTKIPRPTPNQPNQSTNQDEEIGTPVCPEGYDTDDKACTKITKATPQTTSSCPDGSDDIGRAEVCGVYVGEAEPYQKCPDGTIFEIEEKTKLYCFTKFRSNTEGCSESALYGSYYDEASKKCYYASVDAQTFGRCQGEQIVHKNRCYQPKAKKVTYNCEAGYELQNKDCVKTERTDQKMLCPSDYTYDEENNRCFSCRRG